MQNLWPWAEPMPLPGPLRCGRSAMPEASWLQSASPAFRLMIATSWLAPTSWQEKQEQAIREAIQVIGAGVDWMEYLRLVDRHRTPALSWAALRRVPGLVIPEPAKKELQRRSDACRIVSTGPIHPCVPFLGFGAKCCVAGRRTDNAKLQSICGMISSPAGSGRMPLSGNAAPPARRTW